MYFTVTEKKIHTLVRDYVIPYLSPKKSAAKSQL